MGLQPNRFRYYLTLDQIQYEIGFAPSGWDTDTIVSYARDQAYFGVFRSLGLPIQFVLDGAGIVRTAFYKYGLEAGVIFHVDELNPATWQYENAFLGNLDFSKFKDTGDFVEVTLMESGVTALVKAYKDVTYEYPLTGDDIVNMILPGIGFTETYTGDFLATLDIGDNDDDYIPGTTLTNDPLNTSGYVEVLSNDKSDNFPDFTTSGNWFLLVNRAVTMTISGVLKGFHNSGSNAEFRIMNSLNATIYNLPLPSDFPNQPFSVTFTGQPGVKYFFFLTTDERSNIDLFDGGNYTLTFTSASDPSNCTGITAFNLFKRIMKRITPGSPVDSFMLKNTYKNLIYTSGDGIRQIPTAAIKISFSDFFSDFIGLDDSAFGVENGIVRLENSPYFARDTESVNIGDVTDFDLELADQYVFNSVTIGYDDGNTDDTNGKEEYNSGQEWEMPITRVQKQMEWTCKSRADQYGIEQLRIDYIQNPTEDTSSDNDTFMIDCAIDVDMVTYRPILGSTYTLVTGLTSPNTSYNLRLTPKKNLLRHAGYLRSMLDKLDGYYINFGSGTKNTTLVTLKDGVRVAESENIQISTLPGKYFLPYTATVTAKLPINTMQLIDNNPFGYITFSWNGVSLQGYILQVDVDIAKNTERQYKLLLTNNNDLLKLV